MNIYKNAITLNDSGTLAVNIGESTQVVNVDLGSIGNSITLNLPEITSDIAYEHKILIVDLNQESNESLNITIQPHVNDSIEGENSYVFSGQGGYSFYVEYISPNTWAIMNEGFQGPQGYQGLTGPQGPEGFQGFQGLQGPQGPEGFQGLTGVQGFQGLQGPQGTEGSQGLTGPQGFQGDGGLGANCMKVYYDSADVTAGETFSIDGFAFYDSSNNLLLPSSTEDYDNIAYVYFNYFNFSTLNTLITANNYQYITINLSNVSPIGDGPNSITITINDIGVIAIEGSNIMLKYEVNELSFSGASDNLVDDSPFILCVTNSGVPGPQGNQGPQGLIGLTGPQGVEGLQGPQGPQGFQGSTPNCVLMNFTESYTASTSTIDSGSFGIFQVGTSEPIDTSTLVGMNAGIWFIIGSDAIQAISSPTSEYTTSDEYFKLSFNKISGTGTQYFEYDVQAGATIEETNQNAIIQINNFGNNSVISQISEGTTYQVCLINEGTPGEQGTQGPQGWQGPPENSNSDYAFHMAYLATASSTTGVNNYKYVTSKRFGVSKSSWNPTAQDFGDLADTDIDGSNVTMLILSNEGYAYQNTNGVDLTKTWENLSYPHILTIIPESNQYDPAPSFVKYLVYDYVHIQDGEQEDSIRLRVEVIDSSPSGIDLDIDEIYYFTIEPASSYKTYAIEQDNNQSATYSINSSPQGESIFIDTEDLITLPLPNINGRSNDVIAWEISYTVIVDVTIGTIRVETWVSDSKNTTDCHPQSVCLMSSTDPVTMTNTFIIRADQAPDLVAGDYVKLRIAASHPTSNSYTYVILKKQMFIKPLTKFEVTSSDILNSNPNEKIYGSIGTYKTYN